MSKEVGKVLVVDDEESLRDLLRMFFEFEGWTVIESHNGMKAQAELDNSSFDLIVSDIKMPLVDGLELLDYSKAKFPDTKFILITGLSEIIETIDAHNKGADNFLAKPFDAKKLQEVVASTLNPPSEIEQAEADLQYVDVAIEDFYSASTLMSDIYIKLGATRRLKVANCGEKVPKDRLDAYALKGVTHLSIPKDDFQYYVKFNLKLAGAIKDTKSISTKTKNKQLQHTIEMALTESIVGEPDKDLIVHSKQMVLAIANSMLETEEHGDLLALMNDHSPRLFSHSVGVSLYSVLLSEKIGWHSTRTKGLIAMAGLYHDIGKKELPAELLEKPRSKFTHDEMKLWESHAARGRDILIDLGGIPTEVIQAIQHHHYYIKGTLGQGYSISDTKPHPYAQIIALVDMFCNFCLKNLERDYTVKEAFVRIIDYHLEEINKEYLVALMQVMNEEVPKMLLGGKQQNGVVA